MFGVALDEDGFHSQVAAELDVGEAVADHDACFCFDVGEIGLRLLEHAGAWLAAGALLFIVNAKVIPIYVSTVSGEFALQLRMDLLHIVCRVQTQGNPTLVGHNKNFKPGLIKSGDGLSNTRQQVEMLPTSNVLPFRHFAIDDSVTIEEYSFEFEGSFWRSAHAAMITTAWPGVVLGPGNAFHPP